jgi:hypothetical protein
VDADQYELADEWVEQVRRGRRLALTVTVVSVSLAAVAAAFWAPGEERTVAIGLVLGGWFVYRRNLRHYGGDARPVALDDFEDDEDERDRDGLVWL